MLRRIRSIYWGLGVLVCTVGLHSVASASRSRLPPPPTTNVFVSQQTLQQLSAAIQSYERIAQAGGWPTLPKRISLRPGDSDQNVLTLRRRLKATGDMPANVPDAYEYDQNVKAAVISYQLRNGLQPTGKVFGVTLRSLNASVGYRLKQMRTNLGRMQELLPKLTSDRYLLMNASSFEVQGVSNGRVEIASRTIVGKRQTPTPVVSASIRAVNLLPYWHVPGSIAQRALVPAIRKDPAYLFKQRIRVFSSFGGEEVDPSTVNWWGPESKRYVFRQDPGTQNALGVVRLDMPNKHIVYMHDTPMKQLFNAHERAYSAGCVRVQTVIDIAAWLVNGRKGWTRDRIGQAIATGQRETIKLPKAVPVHFIYLTAWVENGRVQFRNDLYNRDGELRATAAPRLSSMHQSIITP
jgi:L,D-transpeptidase YcbB